MSDDMDDAGMGRSDELSRLTAEVRELADRLEIIGLLDRYAAAIDGKDERAHARLVILRGLVEMQFFRPEGWADYARTPTFQQPGVDANRYGAHWWLDFGGPGSFSANGYDGQFIIIRPDRDLIIVRHGVTPLVLKENLKSWLGNLAACFG